jgi:tRNA nucleotidyltransferase (CCA-adding enzyme)
LPRVEPAPLAEDLRRRDFTVNAVALALGGARAGTLEAAEGALDDLDSKLLRVLHDRSFIDDPTRLLRLARYASRLRFAIEAHTRALATAAVESDALQTVSGARIGAELRLLAREPDPVAAFAVLEELGLDAAIAPAFGIDDATLARRALALLGEHARADLLAIAAAARGVPPARLGALLDELAFEAADRDAIVAAARDAEPLARALEQAGRPSGLAAAIGPAGPELVALAGALGPAEPAAEWLERLRHVRLEIDGRDLLAAGVEQGPAIGRGLQAALHAKLDGLIDGREQELQAALAAAHD